MSVTQDAPTVTGTGAGAAAPAPVPGRARPQVLDVDEVGGRVERTVLPGGLRVLTETMPGVLLGDARHLGRRRLPGRDAGAGRRLALPRAPAVQGHARPARALDIAIGDGRRRR